MWIHIDGARRQREVQLEAPPHLNMRPLPSPMAMAGKLHLVPQHFDEVVVLVGLLPYQLVTCIMILVQLAYHLQCRV